MGGLGKAANRILVTDGPHHPDVVGGRLDLGRKRLRAGQAEDVADAVVLAPVHRFGPPVMAVATNGDCGRRPVTADRPDEPAQMAPDLAAGRRLARPEDHRDGTARSGVVDVDGEETAFVVVGVEQRELLLAMHNVAGVVDVQGDGIRRHGVAGAVHVDQHPPEPDQIAQAGGILHPQDGGLAH